MSDKEEARASFTNMASSTQEDWLIIGSQFVSFAGALPDRVLAHLRLLEGDYGGFPIDRLAHCLQTATLAHRDGRDEEYVVCALLHDIGDTLGTYNHADIAAGHPRGPSSPRRTAAWSKKNAIFQGDYFFHHLGMSWDMREAFRATRTSREPRSSARRRRTRLRRPRQTLPPSISSRCCGGCSQPKRLIIAPR